MKKQIEAMIFCFTGYPQRESNSQTSLTFFKPSTRPSPLNDAIRYSEGRPMFQRVCVTVSEQSRAQKMRIADLYFVSRRKMQEVQIEKSEKICREMYGNASLYRATLKCLRCTTTNELCKLNVSEPFSKAPHSGRSFWSASGRLATRRWVRPILFTQHRGLRQQQRRARLHFENILFVFILSRRFRTMRTLTRETFNLHRIPKQSSQLVLATGMSVSSLGVN